MHLRYFKRQRIADESWGGSIEIQLKNSWVSYLKYTTGCQLLDQNKPTYIVVTKGTPITIFLWSLKVVRQWQGMDEALKSGVHEAGVAKILQSTGITAVLLWLSFSVKNKINVQNP